MRPTSLEKFKQIYQQIYGIRLEEQEAYYLATNLLNLYRLVYLEESLIENLTSLYITHLGIVRGKENVYVKNQSHE